MEQSIINRKRIVRLIRYKNALKKLHNSGETKVYSNIIADLTGEKPTQVRKDFSLLKITGNKKSGYDIGELIFHINTILSKKETNHSIIVGCGKIAKALMEYQNFQEENMEIAAGFDISLKKVNRTKAIPILPLEEMDQYIREHDIKVAIITVPAIHAQSTFDKLKQAGIKAVLNFAPITLKDTDNITVKYINLDVELESLFYFVNAL